MNIYLEAAKLEEKGIAFAIATIISAKGSTPRNTAKMIIKHDQSIIGTIGGGPVELQVIKDAVTAIGENQSKVLEYKLNHEVEGGIEMLCGGSIEVCIEVVAPKPHIIMIGAGHVGLAISKLAELLDYQLTVIDDREEFANRERFPKAIQISCDLDIREAISKVQIDPNAYVLIATADKDPQALRKVIYSDAAYIGMIGSKRKTKFLLEKFEKEGVPSERLNRIYSPVGLDIGSETPEEIAVSIMAEIMKVRNRRTGSSMKEVK